MFNLKNTVLRSLILKTVFFYQEHSYWEVLIQEHTGTLISRTLIPESFNSRTD